MPDLIKPEKVGLSTQRLTRIDSLIDEYVERQNIAGAITLVARRGELAHLKCHGLMDFEKKRPMEEDAIFRIYSMTKPITAVAIMMLYEQGHFRLDTPVHAIIPEFRNLRVFKSGTADDYETEKPKRPMIIKDLLMHTAGFTYHFVDANPVDELYRRGNIGKIITTGTGKEFIEALAQIPLVFSPGEKWNYSVSIDVLGYIIEVISGMSLEDFFKKNIFEPLGMQDTSFWLREEQLDRLAKLYTHRRFLGSDATNPLPRMIGIKKSEVPKDATLVHMRPPLAQNSATNIPKFCQGGGGLYSTMDDYYKFASMLLAKGKAGKHQLLSPRTVELMTMNHLDGDLESNAVPGFSEIALKGSGFGFAMASSLGPVASGSLDSFGQFSWGGAASTFFFVDPKEDMLAILMAQLFPSASYPIRHQFGCAVHQAILD